MPETPDDAADAEELIRNLENTPDTLRIMSVSADGAREISPESLIQEIRQRTEYGLRLIAAHRRTRQMIKGMLGKI